ncbi:MAG: nitrous oxide reductase accessory protein NosL [Desulfurivibrionaceae bacterium]|nr:nitrous oxide reductase accessory protein NosL [Desulfurivibrionaceae bacterium]
MKYAGIKKPLSWIFFLSLLIFAAPAGAATPADIAEIPSCGYCGMDREKFAHSRVYLSYADGTKAGVCSLHCAAIEMIVKLDKEPLEIMVGDFNTRELINADKAYWVIGGDMMGVMTRRAKWAFADKAAAEKFIKEHGGTMATFEEALKASFEDMYEDVNMIREKRKMMRMKKMQHM